MSNQYEGKDNYGRLKSSYIRALSEMSDSKLESECYQMIYHAARCVNNPKADWHWMADACYDEAKKRDEKALIYRSAYERCYAENAS